MPVRRSVSPPPGAAAGTTTSSDDEQTQNDETMLAAVRRGDARVAAQFYSRVQPVVERVVCRLFGRSDCDREDLVQIALVHVVESLPRYRGDCPLNAWLSVVSANVVYKYIRRRKLERRIFESALDGPEPAGAPASTGVQRILARDATRRVADHLAAMAPDRSWAFVLHDVCGYSVDEVADICGVSVAAAQSRLVRGRHDLHDRIAGDPSLAGALERGNA